MTKSVITIRYATIDDAENVASFRIEQFKSAKEFQIIDLNAVGKQRGKIFIAEIDEEIISTIQMEVINDGVVFEKIATCLIPENFKSYKTIYLSKGACAKEYRNIGLNSFLRMLILQDAIKNENILSLSGTAYSDAPRINLLKKLGYKLVEIPPNLNYAIPLGKELFLCLKREKFNTAYKLLQDETQELESNYTINVQIN